MDSTPKYNKICLLIDIQIVKYLTTTRNSFPYPELTLTKYLGKNVIINFWASWCAPCIKEFPVENKIYLENKDKGLVIINICIDTPIDHWTKISLNQLKVISLYSPIENSKSLKISYNINSLPRSILLNKKGQVIDNYFKRASGLSEADITHILIGN